MIDVERELVLRGVEGKETKTFSNAKRLPGSKTNNNLRFSIIFCCSNLLPPLYSLSTQSLAPSKFSVFCLFASHKILNRHQLFFLQTSTYPNMNQKNNKKLSSIVTEQQQQKVFRKVVAQVHHQNQTFKQTIDCRVCCVQFIGIIIC